MINPLSFPTLAVATVLSLACFPCLAEPQADSDHAPVSALWLSPGIWSHHFDRSAGYREDNWGIGVQADLAHDISLMGGNFINSDRTRSHYAGAMWLPLELGFARLGLYGGAFDGYPHMRDGDWFLAAMPVASLRYGPVGVNLTLVPNYGNRLHGAVAAQFIFRVW